LAPAARDDRDLPDMRIARLDQVVADAIAAGEVVERPASVVKELVENGIDAGARRIAVEVDGAGLERILVIDDGAGIQSEDLPLAFMRHATSKLGTIADLGRVESLGFRGEALASIAAVSRVHCRSAPPGATQGAAITVEHGVVDRWMPAAPVPGTQVEVRGLFENTPARRAFVKRPATEVAAVVRALVALALCHPEVGFRLSVDGRRTLDTTGEGDVARTLHGLLRGGLDTLEVNGTRDQGAVSGVIAEPAHLRRSREHLYLSVNGRPTSSRTLAVAVEQAYRGLVIPGVFPVGALALRVAVDSIDVNVHPTKREVRFREERAIFGLIQSSCLDALSRSAAYAGAGLLPGTGRLGEGPTEYLAPGTRGDGVPAHVRPSGAVPVPVRSFGAAARAGAMPAAGAITATVGVEEPRLPLPHAAAGAQDGLLPIIRGPYRLVGQVMDCYIVAEGPGGLVLVDQHAAHERVLFNQLYSTRGTAQAASQQMLVPALLHLTPVQAACLEDSRADLAAAGLEIDDFGGGSARLVAHSPALPVDGIDRMALDVLDSLIAEGREVDQSRRLERATYTVACHSAIKFGQRLSREEMESLLRQLETAEPGITCPHGRPTILEISDSQLRREFRRT
jgi:DNA mismatch repair protein MutL